MKKETIGSLFELFKLSIRKMCTVRVLLPLAVFVLLNENIISNVFEISALALTPFFEKDDVSVASAFGMAGLGMLFLVALLCYFLFLCIVVFVVAPAYFVSTENQSFKVDIKNVWSLIKKRWINLAKLFVIVGCLFIGAVSVLVYFESPLVFLICAVPIVYLALRFYVVMYAVVYDGFGVRKSLSISTKIMDGIKGKFFVFLFLSNMLIQLPVKLLFKGFIALLSPEYLSFLDGEMPITEDFMDSITLIDYGFREFFYFITSFISSLLIMIPSGVAALLYLKRRSLAVSTN